METWDAFRLIVLAVQDAVAVLYALLQRYGEAMCSDAAGRHAIATTADAMLALLQVRTCPRMLITAAHSLILVPKSICYAFARWVKLPCAVCAVRGT